MNFIEFIVYSLKCKVTHQLILHFAYIAQLEKW